MSGAQVVTGRGFRPHAVFDGSKIVTQAGQSLFHNGLTVAVEDSQTEAKGTEEVITVEEVTDGMVFLIGGHANGVCNSHNLTITCELPCPGIETQAKAQDMLERAETAIADKDNIRAALGALQNRLENAVTSLDVQAENLQAAESRISDVDVAAEMTEFVRRQIPAQSAVAMLSQANSIPRMAMQFIGG